MKRDMDIMRKILLNVEDDVYVMGQQITLDGVSVEVCAYHVALMQDAGLVEAHVIKTSGCHHAAAIVNRMTSAGHDFCDGIRNDTIWNKAKKHIIKPGASYGLSELVEYVKVQVHREVFGGG